MARTGEHTEKLKEFDNDAIGEPTLVSSVEDRLANLRDITTESEEVEEPAETEDESKEPTPAEDEQADNEDESEGSTPEKTDEGESTDDEQKELPPAYLRAAVHRGWKEDDVKEFFEQNPDAALKTFQNCYMDVNNASKEWAILGKAKMKNLGVTDGQPEPQPEGPKKLDIAKLKDEYDLDDETVKQLEAQNAQLEQLQQAQPVQQQPAQPSADPNIELQIENFFGSEGLKDYGDFYGEVKLGQNWNDLSAGQRDNRWKVIEQANCIAVGMEAMGKEVDLLDVLERAHMQVTAPIMKQIEREKIRKQVEKRGKSLTTKPSDGSRSVKKVTSEGKKSGVRTREELIEDTQGKLNQLFG